ncbi:HD domain-containing protein [Halocalculus aciditolerans]|uniref:Phosphohydrolase n=1 Tax=Halocalculus aciditolerans TaxID=1383812 RepID=A0A830FGF1_9EURY|nr:HD domain-containing protein [Halocalculus aciditolerans]GGL52761.1 phosphohydrolase [Halocalculus aciditolerans]
MSTIKDSVHDHITVDGVAADLLDTPPIQRLRRIKQLGTVSYVYPSANHTRFEHSLGVYHLACEALDHLGIDGARAERTRAAAILHDIGHGPYSHNVESLLHRHTGRYHDDVDDLVATGPVARVLDDHGIDPATIADMVRGDGELAQLVAGELDVDRMDYLVRDAHHTGVPYGTIDHERLVRELAFIDGELVLGEGNVQTAESLLVARALMNPTVYNHHVARISKAMLRRATEALVDAGDAQPQRVRRMDDAELQVALRAHDASRDLADRLADRDLYKRAVWAEMADVFEDVVDPDAGLLDATHGERRALEDDIAADADVDPDHVIIDVQSAPGMRETTTRVLVNGDIRRLGDQSTLVRALQMAQREQWRLGVYTPTELTEPVGRAAERVLGLQTDGALIAENASHGQYTSLSDF